METLWYRADYVDAKSGNTFEIRNPADDSLVASNIQVAGSEDIDEAVAAATAAFNGPWRSLTGAQRGDLLHKFADLLNDHLDQVSSLETGSMGIPISVSRMFASVAVSYFHYYAGYADKLEGGAFPADDGVYKIVPERATGGSCLYCLMEHNRTIFRVEDRPSISHRQYWCPIQVIFKASEKSPLGALTLGRLFIKASFPPSVINLVTGGGETDQLLASHQKIRKISFTGSVAVGRKVQEAATKSNLKRVTLELRGKSPAIIFDDAGLDKAMSALRWYVDRYCLGKNSKTLTSATAASRVYVHESVVSEFVVGLKANFEGANRTLGQSPLDPQTVLRPVADSIQFNRVLDFIKDGERTAQLVTGDARIYREEIFGPVVVIKTFRTEDEVIALANNTEYGLSACLYTENISRALRVASKIESGTVAVNSAFLPSPSTAFSGFKQSGNGGRESSKYALHDYLQRNTIHIK
uniref:aldehyde dehydrogenase (NAD(+)) n=1 Tax=Bionectria ochroleuca TaxID=29856 RepID=A0A0B7KJ19_BIOOC